MEGTMEVLDTIAMMLLFAAIPVGGIALLLLIQKLLDRMDD